MQSLPLALTVAAIFAASAAMGLFRKRRSFAGKHVLITGGSTGIGQAAAQQLVAQGAYVSLVARSRAKLDAAKAQIEAAASGAAAGRVHTFPADVTKADDVRRIVADAEAAQGPIFCLICSAGSSTPGKFLEQDAAVFASTMELNYMGTVNALKAVLPGMVQRQDGHVLVVASVMAIIGFTGYASYAPSKWAVRGLCDCLRNELAGSGVGVSIAYPPDTDTPGYEIEKDLMVAKCIVSGVARGDYHIRGPDAGLNMLVASMAGFSPRVYTWVFEIVLAPIFVLLSKLAVPLADRVVRKHAAAGGNQQ